MNSVHQVKKRKVVGEPLPGVSAAPIGQMKIGVVNQRRASCHRHWDSLYHGGSPLLLLILSRGDHGYLFTRG